MREVTRHSKVCSSGTKPASPGGREVGGATTHQEVNVWSLQKAIREAGFEPVERDTLYRRVVRDGKRWHVAQG